MQVYRILETDMSCRLRVKRGEMYMVVVMPSEAPNESAAVLQSIQEVRQILEASLGG